MPRPRKPRKPQNHERWMVTYSDLITLLLVFFIIMFAMSSVDKIKFATLAESLASALHPNDQIPLNGLGTSSLLLSGDNNTGVQSPLPAPTPAKSVPTEDDQQQLQNLYQLAKNYINSHNLQNKVSITNQQRGVQITMKDIALFDTGQAALKPDAQQLIAGFVPFFKSLPNNIVVEGYTDNQPISTSVYPSNWELSSARAMSVVRFLASNGVNADRLSGTGYGQYHNIVPNNTAAHRQQNRRVNIVVLRQDTLPGTVAALPQSNAPAK
ncbi:OmpA family protein [Alicyclobacillus fastidiosus]|uniref:OmpA family protein n=1 Tax=Alicyclobacillus fastidiosus TaxID=392011 RepID=A0ABY6ZFH6_9BACL|nr:flagellar motor protein MotB [Alicyclobacillus fastidiosus]WAH41604.1 OmpA family protein [Alicyclobacillus fastidiosus]GMA63267.1 chemotaxis protein MotB [Alicyclobacillus fastidiosus]